MALSDTWLKGQLNKERDKVTEKADRDGLSARISAKGKITFQTRFRLPGHTDQQRLDLGTYTELTLAQARAQCLKYRAEIQFNNAPRVTRRMEQLSIGGADSLIALFNEWYEKSTALCARKNMATSSAGLKYIYSLRSVSCRLNQSPCTNG